MLDFNAVVVFWYCLICATSKLDNTGKQQSAFDDCNSTKFDYEKCPNNIFFHSARIFFTIKQMSNLFMDIFTICFYDTDMDDFGENANALKIFLDIRVPKKYLHRIRK